MCLYGEGFWMLCIPKTISTFCLHCLISWSVFPNAYMYVHVFFFSSFVCVLMWSTDIFLGCLTFRQSVGGDIHRGAFSGTFMRYFFPWLKGGWPHTVRLPQLCALACVFVRAHTSLSVHAPFLWAPLCGLPGVCFASCFVLESPPPCCGSVAGRSGSSPPVLRQCH